MEKYLSAVSEMYSQFKKREAHPMEKYIGRLARCGSGEYLEVVGYLHHSNLGGTVLIVDASTVGGWTNLGPDDVIFKDCKGYWYASIRDLTA